jgi:hypothetical protein
MEARPGAGELALLPRALRLHRFLRSGLRSGGSQWLGSRPGSVALGVRMPPGRALLAERVRPARVVVDFGNVSAKWLSFS